MGKMGKTGIKMAFPGSFPQYVMIKKLYVAYKSAFMRISTACGKSGFPQGEKPFFMEENEIKKSAERAEKRGCAIIK